MVKKKNNEMALPRLFEDPLAYWNSIAKEFSMPIRANLFGSMPIDLIDEGDSIRIKADMPGVDKGDIKLNVTKGNVSISAESKNESEKKGKKLLLQRKEGFKLLQKHRPSGRHRPEERQG